ncbi:hypothetical protein [Streptomyces sp. CA-106131]|uniref:hypothetical protein n=1 Tax=Streptomyces sp. CA-106131 TaxID=3240045 RepID=UPI003D8B2F44
MDEHDHDALHAAFQAILSTQPEPPMPSVTDAAVAGGRRIHRRRAALSTAGALAVAVAVAAVVTMTNSLPRAGTERAPLPLAPASADDPTSAATPHPATPAPKNSGAAATHHAAASAVPHLPVPDPRGGMTASRSPRSCCMSADAGAR